MNTGYGEACLHVRARVAGPIRLPAPALDALLGAMVCLRDGIAPAAHEAELSPLRIPIQREPGGRFYLSSFAACEPESRELRHRHKRFPVEEAQMFGHGLGRVQITAGPSKSYRIPYETVLLRDDLVHWWCVGDAEGIGDLLAHVTHLAKFRGVGLGAVAEWSVEPCDGWSGFPVVRDGLPLRPLPVDWPGLGDDAAHAFRVLDMPYWMEARAKLVAVPC